ncbi:NLP/P60 [Ktedonobacteria bacterium brp13]|nr:NLP/P60 [Ktedonobacteria bacterium brp13]
MNVFDMNIFVIAVCIADIHADPASDSEVVTQALMNTSVVAGDVQGAWTRVTLPDYAGWIRTAELELPIVRGVCEEDEGTCGVPLPYSLLVTVPVVPVYIHAQGEEKWYDVYLSTALPYIDLAHPSRLRVALPGEREGWIPREYVAMRRNDLLFETQDLRVVTDYARTFLDIPYLWGGTSWRGIDCSGLVQLCYRMGGNILPRDADQQCAALPQSVEQDALREGDLLFFGRESITHVALALNAHEYIHAEGQNYHRVLINSLDPHAANYNERLAALIKEIKRVRDR